MKLRTRIFMSMLSVLAALTLPLRPAAQEHSNDATQKQRPTRFSVTDLGTLGGTYSFAYDINNTGWVAGGSSTRDQVQNRLNQHAFLWTRATGLYDLGTLGGKHFPNLNSEGAGSNGSGEVALLSETALPDPLNKDFCAFGTHQQCLAAIWKNGAMKPLATQPYGHNAQAYGINNQGQVVGFAENGTPDLTCLTPSQVLRFDAVIWGRNGKLQKLSTLPGDEVSFAFGINDKGQAVGVSGKCADTVVPPGTPDGPPTGPNAVLWEKDGTPRNLGSLFDGGAFNVATSINNRGEVVGAAQSEDGSPRAFIWTPNKGMQPLGLLPGGVASVAPCLSHDKRSRRGGWLFGRRDHICIPPRSLAKQGSDGPQRPHPEALAVVPAGDVRDQRCWRDRGLGPDTR